MEKYENPNQKDFSDSQKMKENIKKSLRLVIGILGITNPLFLKSKIRELKMNNENTNREILLEKEVFGKTKTKMKDMVKQIDEVCGVLEKQLMRVERDLSEKLYDIRGRAEKIFKKEKLEGE